MFASYSCNCLVTLLLAVGDPLAMVQREAEAGLAFVQKASFGRVIDFLTTQLQLIRSLRGMTRKLGSFDDEDVRRGSVRAAPGGRSAPRARHCAGTGSASCRRGTWPATTPRRWRRRPGRGRCCGRSRRSPRPPSTCCSARSRAPPTTTPRPRTSGQPCARRSRRTTRSSRRGRSTAPRTSATAPRSPAPSSRGSAARRTRRPGSTSRRSAPRARTASSRSRRSPTRSPRGSIAPAATR